MRLQINGGGVFNSKRHTQQAIITSVKAHDNRMSEPQGDGSIDSESDA